MTVLVVILLALLLIAGGLLVLAPLRATELADPDAPVREQLEAERERLFAELRGLPDHVEAGERDRRPELEGRAARVLRSLDALPPAPAGRLPRGWLWGGLLLAAVLVAVGAFSFVPGWQLAGLNSSEASAVKTAVQLPGLAARARASGSVPDELSWGNAAFDAGQYDQAAAAYASALKQNPRQPEALRRLGIILLTRNDGQSNAASKPNDQAFLLIRTAAQLAPDEPESQLLLGFALSRYGENQAALTALERYRTLNPSGRDADDMITMLRAQLNKSDPGQAVYAANCASCHGTSGNGGIGPSLRRAGLTQDTLTGITLHGKGTMPAFPQLQGKQLSALVALVLEWQK
ncbi:c-type cytochrome [Deinococcus sp. KNUC1210]|uniref:c-type cytochrome n=1 Tax=Deinococcus sp. KNUC1210 TaxID=2917691 RepID=UPI001EF0CF2C|nr:cytochrome c [Deinococcus sp. KNUC1210]ULH16710.1 c-type cytochrome [Deinococcus sp. KNUC1210]